MKLLLDENIPHEFRHKCVGHEVRTVAYMGWSSIGNGDLLALAQGEGFDALISMDRGFAVRGPVPISVVVIRAPSNRPEHLDAIVPQLLQVLTQLEPRTVVHVSWQAD